MDLPRHHRLHLFALSGAAVAQPLYDLIGRHATFLVAHGAGAATIIALIAALSVGVPLALLALVELWRLAGPRAAGWVQMAAVGLLTALLTAIAARALPAALALPLAAAAAAGGALAYRASAIRLFLTVLSPAAAIFPLLFVVTTPAGRLLWPDALTGGAAGFAERPPIVFVVFDEMSSFTLAGPDGNIDAARFPHLAAFARTSTWLPNAVATHPFTAYALPALLTGVQVESLEDLPVASDHPRNLFTWLSNAYELRAAEPITRLCPRALCPDASSVDAGTFARDLTVLYLHLVVPSELATGWLPTLGLAWAGFAGPLASPPEDQDHDLNAAFGEAALRGRPGAFREFVGSIRGPVRPVLYFLHVLLPHDPYRRLASGHSYSPPALTDGMDITGRWVEEPWVVEAGRDRHIEQERFADALLGELVARLKSEGLFDDALIVVTSDHGGAFRPGDLHRGISGTNYREVAAVPLLVKMPRQTAAGVDPRPATGLDILPTIAAALGAELPWTADGAALLGDSFPDRRTITYAGPTPLVVPTFDVRAETARRAAAPRIDAQHRPLLGRRVADLETAPPARDLRVFSDNFFAFEDVRPDTGQLPALVRGRIEGQADGSPPLVLALAVNGYIRGLARTFAWHDASHYFAALVDGSSLHAGTNRLDVLTVGLTPAGFRLVPVSTDVTSGLELRQDDAGEFLSTRAGRRIPVAKQPYGYVERVDDDGTVLTLMGWAADPSARGPVRSVVVFAGSRSLASTGVAHERPDVTAALALPPGTAVSFAVALRHADAAAGPVRVIAIGERGAGELLLGDDAAARLRR